MHGGFLQLTARWLPWLQHVTAGWGKPHCRLPPHHATQGEFTSRSTNQMECSDSVYQKITQGKINRWTDELLKLSHWSLQHWKDPPVPTYVVLGQPCKSLWKQRVKIPAEGDHAHPAKLSGPDTSNSLNSQQACLSQRFTPACICVYTRWHWRSQSSPIRLFPGHLLGWIHRYFCPLFWSSLGAF